MISEGEVREATHHRLIAFYLQAGWLYECRDVSIMADETWDLLCRRLDAEWDLLPDIEHKHKIDRSALASATAMHLTEDHVPLICQHVACRRARDLLGVEVKAREPHLLIDMTLPPLLAWSPDT